MLYSKIKINYSHNDSVCNILLDDGKGNVLDNTMMNELISSLKELRENNEIKLITFQGEGKHFSFGASVEEHTKDLAETMIKTFHSLFFLIQEMSIPTMAKISGQCLGGGLELALMCDFMFGDQSAKLGQPEIILGVFPPPASIILPEKIGLARAEELLLSGRSMDAIEAHQIGLVNYLFEDKNQLNLGVDAYIEKYILPKSASSLKFAVKAARIKFNHIFSNFIPQLEFIYNKQLMETYDANEGINAFLEKRTPNWKNN
ncbi:MAG: enoyl-CoA hydratase/isomerase family protein [Flavobacteriia bacterium]|nr:enoyl-CoA hydratase/isomerase family protein [Flavobacteriia bacterium]